MSAKSYLLHHEPVKSHVDLNYVDMSSHQRIWKTLVDTHPFNEALSVFLPTCSVNQISEHLDRPLGSYYEIESDLSILLDTFFLANFIQSAEREMMMHSIDTNINSDDVVVLNPNGQLCLSLVKDTYEKFGMEAMKRTKVDVKHDKHIVVVDLKSPHFKPGSKGFNRLEWCFKNTMTTTFKMVFCATDTLTGTIVDIDFPSQTKSIVKKEMEATIEALTEMNIPSFTNITHDITEKPKERWDSEAMDALEWIGLAHLKSNRIKSNAEPTNPFVSVYQTPDALLSSQRGVIVKWKGFIPSNVIQNLLVHTRKLMESGVTNQWTSVSVWGYKDSPFTWNKVQHYEYYNSENDYTFLLLPNSQFAYTYQLYGSHHFK